MAAERLAEIADVDIEDLAVDMFSAGSNLGSRTAEEIFYSPNHPYTKGLLSCVTNPEADDSVLTPIPGSPPDLLKPPAGCPFLDRCEHAMKICRDYMPEETVFSPTHSSCCWLNQREGASQ